jgi:hypothetical protein
MILSVIVRRTSSERITGRTLRYPTMGSDVFIGRLVSFVLIWVCGAVFVGIVKLINYLDRQDR